MSSSEKLVKWNFFWRITGDVVSCRTCHAEQVEKEGSCAFEHDRGCGHAEYENHPWEELRKMEVGDVI